MTNETRFATTAKTVQDANLSLLIELSWTVSLKSPSPLQPSISAARSLEI